MNVDEPIEEELDFSSLPPWLGKVLQSRKPLQVESRSSPFDNLRNRPEWNLVLDAAMVSTFLPNELPSNLDAPDRRMKERSLLGFAQLTHEPGSRARWSLRSEARAAAINACQGTDRADAASRTRDKFTDDVSRAIRDIVLGTAPTTFDDKSLAQLEALRSAAFMLGNIGLSAINIEELDRALQLQRLLAGFRRMTGATEHATESTKRDHFYGREEDMEILRGHVDVIPAKREHTFSRFLGRAVRVLVGCKPLVVWGSGGIGKTTLMAKFMLEHAHAGKTRYPFAYLDFDRSTINAQDPIGLLIEMCRQVGIQFQEIAAPLTALASDLGNLSQRTRSNAHEVRSILIPHQERFRTIVDSFLEELDARDERVLRPFLLVFDTFEIVQYTPEDVKILERFVADFDESEGWSLWPRLRLVVSGRSQLKSFVSDITTHQLRALQPKAAAEMLVNLTSQMKVSLTPSDSTRLVDALQKAGGDRKEGVHPLRLRLVSEVWSTTVEPPSDGNTAAGPSPNEIPPTSAQLVDTLIGELQTASRSGLNAAFVNGFLVRRIVGRLVDPRVKALADPGLVVRRITPDVIMNVLAVSRPKPDAGKEDRSDNTKFVPWSVDATEAEDIYKAFGREVTLVDEDGSALKYRQDVRREMVPLIRHERPNLFRHIHGLAYSYFSGLASANPSDADSAAEAVYHGLWRNRPIEEVNLFWRSAGNKPDIDPDEFEMDNVASLFLRAKSAGMLQPEELARLGPEIGLEWLQRRQTALLPESGFNELVSAVRTVAGTRFESLWDKPALAAIIARLLYRAGEWDASARLAEQALRRHSIVSEDALSYVSLMRTSLHLAAKSGVATSAGLKGFEHGLRVVSDPVSRVELIAHDMLLKGDRAPEHGLRDAIARVDLNRWAQEGRILRLAILVGGAERLVPNYFGALDRLPRDESTISLAQMLIASPSWEGPKPSPLGKLIASGDSLAVMDYLDQMFKQNLAQAAAILEQREDLTKTALFVIASNHRDWTRPLASALDRGLRSKSLKADAITRALSGTHGIRLRSSRRKGEQTGADLVADANDSGGLLQLARVLVDMDKSRQSSEYPSSAGAIAKALLTWDSKLRASLPGWDDQPSQRAKK